MRNDGLPDGASVMKLPPKDLVHLTVKQIMAHGVSESRAYKLRRKAMADINSEGASESLKDRVLAAVVAHVKFRDVDELRTALGGDDTYYDITRALWGLQKSGDVTFYERKHGHDSILTAISTAKGYRTAPVETRSRGKKHPVGVDMTEPRNHDAQATGGVIERQGARGRVKPEVVPTPQYELPVEPATPRYAAPEPPAQNMRPDPVIDEGFSSVEADSMSVEADPMSVEADLMSMEADMENGRTDTHTQYPRRDVDVDKYPLIADLMGKQSRLAKYEAAAILLEEADAEMALVLLEKIQLTDLEKEIIRFIHGD